MSDEKKRKEEQKEKKAKPIVKRRTVDKWKKKTWFALYAPKLFEGREIGETVAEKPENIPGRTVVVNLREFAQAKRTPSSVTFKVKEVRGNKAFTEVVGHQIPEGFLKRLTRRRCSRVQTVQDIETRDGVKMRVKAMVLTARKTERGKCTDIRKKMTDVIAAAARDNAFEPFVVGMLFGELAGQIQGATKNVAQVKRVEIVKSRVMAS